MVPGCVDATVQSVQAACPGSAGDGTVIEAAVPQLRSGDHTVLGIGDRSDAGIQGHLGGERDDPSARRHQFLAYTDSF